MTEQEKREKVIALLKRYIDSPNLAGVENYGAKIANMPAPLIADALALLKAQEKATIEPKRIDLEDETKAWLDKMDAVDALGNIADICIDWDGYRTADGLGGLVNEIWAYARYCADRLAKAQEPVSVQKKQIEMVGLQTWDWVCGNCGQTVLFGAKFCSWCGRAVKWE